jgi:hypothetical protein
LALVGTAFADEAIDMEAVNRGIQDLETTSNGCVYNSGESISGTGYVNSYSNLFSENSEGSKVQALKVTRSGSGFYSHESSSVLVQNRTDYREGGWTDFSWKTEENENIRTNYSEVDLLTRGTFKSESIRSLWKDRTFVQDYVGLTSMESIFDNTDALSKESKTSIHSNQPSFESSIDNVPGTDIPLSWKADINTKMNLIAEFNGSSHIGAILRDRVDNGSLINRAKNRAKTLIDEDYKGSLFLTENMAVNIRKNINWNDKMESNPGPIYSDSNNYQPYFNDDYGNYPWLPCACINGWNEMTFRDQMYHSAKDIFNCTGL